MIVNEELGDAGGYEALSPTSATGITASLRHPTSGIHKGRMARTAQIVVETNAIRFLLDGTDATANNGLLVQAGQNVTITGVNNVKNFSCIDTAAGASSVKIIVYF